MDELLEVHLTNLDRAQPQEIVFGTAVYSFVRLQGGAAVYRWKRTSGPRMTDAETAQALSDACETVPVDPMNRWAN